jgi:peptidyl-prolyl cis-trans isomerase C
MKLNLIVSAALVAGVISARAASENAAQLSASTNANPETAMTALFGDPVIVKAKSFQIKRSELDQVVSGARANATAAGQQLPSDFDVSVLNQLVTIQVLLQTATPADQAAGKIDADQQYTNLLKRFVSPEAFEKQLKAVGMTVADLRAKATQEAVAKAALKRALNVNISDDDAKAYYTQHSSDFELPEQIHARHILLMTIDPATRSPLSTNTVVAKRRQAEDLLKQIRGGTDFAELAKKYSEDPGSKENGGELPNFSRGQMVPEFESAALALTNSEVSDIVTSPFGFHIIKMLEKIPAKKYGFTDPIPEANGDTPEKICKAGLETQKIKTLAPAFIKKLRGDQQVEIVDANLKAMDEKLQEAQSQAAAAGDLPASGANK